MKSTITFILFFTLLASCAIRSFGQYSNIEFVENKGQWDGKVKYKGDFTTGAFFLTENGFRVLQSNPDDLQAVADMYHGQVNHKPKGKDSENEKSVVVHSHAYDMQFVNGKKATIEPAKPLDTYNNYFQGNDESKWKGNCRIFQAITYREMYKGIDVRYYTDKGMLKYDIIVHPGADATDIAMKYEGQDALQIKNEELVVKTTLGDNRELSPYSYQIVNGQKQVVKCRFKVSGKVVRFDLENYAKNTTLVIDPTLVFSTFTGSKDDNWGYTATYGADGSFYAGGIVFGTGFPVSPGAYDETFNGGANDGGIGGYDIAIIKFNTTGANRLYATYIGGNANEQPHSMVADAQGNLVIAGRTNSGSTYPLKNGGLIGSGGGYDIVITKLNAAGSDIIGSRRIGGSLDDGANIGPKYINPQGELSLRRNYGDDARGEVIFDGNGDILLASNTRSADFPLVTPFQATKGANQDGLIIKASADLSNILVSSFLGGNGNDAAFVLALNPSNGNIFVGGNTESTDLPGNKTGVLQPTFAGNTDGFVSILSADAKTLLKTSYFGTSGFDMLYGIQFDKFGFPYIMGTSTNNWVIKNAAYSEAGGKQFISKLKADLSDYVYSTVFGTNSVVSNISPIAFLVDRCENVYVSGWGGQVDNATGFNSAGTTGMGVTSNAIKKTTDGSDFYFFVLERNAAARLYASFFGQDGGTGEHVDGGTSRFDRDGVIYQALCANCGNNVPFPTTPGAWAVRNGTQNCNLAAVKIAFNLSGIATGIRSSIVGSTNDTVGCVPLRVAFRDTLAQGKKYIWIYGDGTKFDTTTTPSTSHLFTAVGQYQVTLISIDSSKCNIEDTSRLLINVKTFKAFIDFDWQKLQPCDSFLYRFDNLATVVPAAIPFGPASFTWDFGDGSPKVIAGFNSVNHSFPSAGTYNIRLTLTDTNFCNAPIDTVKRLSISNIVKAGIETNANGCTPYTAIFTSTTIAGETYFWDFGDGTTSTVENPVHLYSVPNVYTVKLVVTNSGTCNKRDSAIFIITVSSPPIAGFVFSPNPPSENTPVVFINTSTNADKFLWKFGDGDTLYKYNIDNVEHSYNKTQVFSACLYAYNKSGCIDSVCLPVAARILPLLDVPSAFTPNNDNINDRIYVRGFGIVRMLWRIYNRWGTMVYESINQKEGWDGKYKGSLQPMEVYHYTLDVGYSDNSTFAKKGDITLLR